MRTDDRRLTDRTDAPKSNITAVETTSEKHVLPDSRRPDNVPAGTEGKRRSGTTQSEEFPAAERERDFPDSGRRGGTPAGENNEIQPDERRTAVPFTGIRENTSAHTVASFSEAESRTDTDVAEAKKQLRKKYGALRAAILQKEKEALDLALSREVVSLAEFGNAETVFLYASYASEPDTSRVAREALRRGKILAYPRTDPASHRIAFYRVEDTTDLVPGFHGIPEPPADAEKIIPDGKTFCLVPALSYDRSGFRLGYGGGYYDRFLSECAKRAADAEDPNLFPITVGAVYSRLISEPPLPHGRYDLPVSLILSEKGATETHD